MAPESILGTLVVRWINTQNETLVYFSYINPSTARFFSKVGGKQKPRRTLREHVTLNQESWSCDDAQSVPSKWLLLQFHCTPRAHIKQPKTAKVM